MSAWSPSPATHPVLTRPRLGLLLLLTLPTLAAAAHVEGIMLGPFEYMLYVFLAVGGAASIIQVIECTVRRRSLMPIAPMRMWLPWLVVVWVSLLWTDGASVPNVQFAINLTLPLLIGCLAVLFVENDRHLRLLLDSCTIAVIVAAIFVLALRSGLIAAAGLDFRERGLGLTLVALGVIQLGAWPGSPKRALAGWLACVALAAGTESRMATATLLVAPIFHPSLRPLLRLVVVIAVAGAVTYLLTIPAIRDQLFVSKTNATGLGAIATTGRMDAWPLIIEAALERPVLGAGIGSSALFVPTVWERMMAPHNEFIRLFFELGAIGLGAFLLAVVTQLASLGRMTARTTGVRREAFAAGFVGLTSLLLIAMTDNPLGAGLAFGAPLFAVIGGAYGATLRSPMEGTT